VRWLLEEKLRRNPEHIPQQARGLGFLPTQLLQQYGLGAIWWRRQFDSKDELVAALVETYTTSFLHTWRTTAQLRADLEAAGRPVVRCDIPGCTCTMANLLDIHHIVEKTTPRHKLPWREYDVHAPYNLVAICPTHHRQAGQQANWPSLELVAGDTASVVPKFIQRMTAAS
jgi:hypothetical protein